MWSDSESRQHPEAAYYGVASILLAGVLLLMALPALQLAFWLQATNYPGWGRTDKALAAYGGYIGAALVILLCLVGIGIGMRGRGAAARTGEPAVLCTVGMILGAFGAALWVAAVLAWHSQIGRFV